MAQLLILLVDDIPDHSKLYEAALRQSGYRVHLVSTGKVALDVARSERPDCAVIDVRLPDMDGWEVCRLMKADASAKATPVVILSPDITETCATEGARSGCSAWLAHPTLARDVPRVVDHVLAQHRPSPGSARDAIVGVAECRACGSDQIRATLRLGAIQYYTCRSCNLSWRVDAVESVA